mgnify:CR=1 FL=1
MQPVSTKRTLAATPGSDQAPWWRVPMVWVVIAGPFSVVVASLATAVIAWKHIDPIIHDDKPEYASMPREIVLPDVDPKANLAPAMQARNHAASPSR